MIKEGRRTKGEEKERGRRRRKRFIKGRRGEHLEGGGKKEAKDVKRFRKTRRKEQLVKIGGRQERRNRKRKRRSWKGLLKSGGKST